jgi:hypothetical protein
VQAYIVDTYTYALEEARRSRRSQKKPEEARRSQKTKKNIVEPNTGNCPMSIQEEHHRGRVDFRHALAHRKGR